MGQPVDSGGIAPAPEPPIPGGSDYGGETMLVMSAVEGFERRKSLVNRTATHGNAEWRTHLFKREESALGRSYWISKCGYIPDRGSVPEDFPTGPAPCCRRCFRG